MSDNKIIATSVQVDTDAAQKNVLKLQGTVADLKKEFKKAEAGSDEQLAALKKLQAAEEDLAKANQKLNEANKETAGHFSKIKEGLSQLPGAAGAAGKGVEGLNTQFKALLANPIGLVITAIVLALTLLYKAFTNTFEGAQKVEQVFAGVKAAAQALFDNIGHLASALVKFFTFDFSGAVNEIKGVVDAASNAYSAMAKLTKQAQDLHKEQLANDLDQAERQKKLAILREEATDESIPLAKRKAALKELKEAAEQNAKEDIDLAKRTAENKIAQLTLEKDGAKKNQDEINQIKIEQIRVETDNANELRRIGKQLTAADKQELAEQKEARQKAAEEEKKRRQELIEYTNKLTKLQQENELAQIKDGYQKELKALDNRIADEKRQNEVSFQEKKITREQLNQLNAALDIQANIQRDDINEKHNKEVAAKEEAFQKDIEDRKTKIRLSKITDNRELEKAQMEVSYQEQLKAAIKLYKDNQDEFQAAKALIDEQYRIDQQKLDKKNADEDAKKKLETDINNLAGIAADPKAAFQARRDAIDQEIKDNQELYDKKLITIEQFTARDKEFHKARVALGKEEVAAALDNAGKIGNLFENLSDLIGKQTAAGKALSVANATIQAIQSAVSSYNAMASIPFVGPALGAVAAAAALASGFANVKKILAVKVPGHGDGAAPNLGGVTAPAAPVAPTQTSTSLDQNTINNIGNAAAGGVNSVRAYVVEQDSQAAAARAQRLQGAAVLGG